MLARKRGKNCGHKYQEREVDFERNSVDPDIFRITAPNNIPRARAKEKRAKVS